MCEKASHVAPYRDALAADVKIVKGIPWSKLLNQGGCLSQSKESATEQFSRSGGSMRQPPAISTTTSLNLGGKVL